MSDDRLVVIARVRPLSRTELARKEDSVIAVTGSSLSLRQAGLGSRLGKRFLLDCVLDEKSTQHDVFSQVEPMLQTALDGYNATIFTYGQSGSGKTYSMLGYDLWAMARDSLLKLPRASTVRDSRGSFQPATLDIATDYDSVGIIPRTMEWLFTKTNPIKESGGEVKVFVSYLEIHNEKLVDLLNSSDPVIPSYNSPVRGCSAGSASNFNVTSSSKQSLDIREVSGDVYVAGLTLIEVETASEVLEILWIGARARCVAVTDLNEHSSRSHTIFQVHLELSNSQTQQGTRSKISLVDLAGSEKLRAHQMLNITPERIRELTCINKSLSSLSNCISALLQRSRVHVPYRDSKLTRILQHSLGGNTRSAFVVTLSPSVTCYEETLSTLKFASRAIKVSLQLSPNRSSPVKDSAVESSSEELQNCKGEILELKKMVEFLLRKCTESSPLGQTLLDGRSPILMNIQNHLENTGHEESHDEVLVRTFSSGEEQSACEEKQPTTGKDARKQKGKSKNKRPITDDCLSSDLGSRPPEKDHIVVCQDLLTSSSSLLYPSAGLSPSPLYSAIHRVYAAESSTNGDSPNGIEEMQAEKVLIVEQNNSEHSDAIKPISCSNGRLESMIDLDSPREINHEMSAEWLSKYHQWLLSMARCRLQTDNSVSKGAPYLQIAPSLSSINSNSNSNSSNYNSSYSNGRNTLTPTALSSSFSEEKLDHEVRDRDAEKEIGREGGGEELIDRLCLMEMSVLIQAEELAVAKQLFLQTNTDLQVKLQESTRQCDDLRASGTKIKRKSISKTQKSIPVSAAVEVSPVVLQNTLKELDKKPKPLITLTELSTPINADRHDLPHTPRSSTAPARARNSQSPARTGDRSGSDVSRACEAHTRNGFEEIGKHDNTMIAMKSYNRAVASHEAEVEEASLVNPSAAQDEQHAAYLQYEIQSTRQSEEYRRLALEGQGCGYGTGDNSSVGSVKSSVTTPSECNSSSIVGAPKTRSTTPVQQKVQRRKTLWAEYLDPASGLQYYHNRLTKETTWDMPSPNEMLQLLPLI